MASSEKKLFILGTLLTILALLTLMLLQSSFKKNSEPINEAIIADSPDSLISKQLAAKDILPEDKPLITFIDPKRGAKNPKVTIVEFSDFSCPFCKSIQNTLDKIIEKYPVDVMHVWKDAPHGTLYIESMNAHIAARCAQKQQKFWEFHDELFKNQNTLSDFAYQSIASGIKMELDSWQVCFEEQDERAKVERDLIEAEVLGVDSTPYFFINDKRVSGAITFEELDLIVAKELQKISNSNENQ
jgi:protein-disulfide isomerase